MSDLTRHTAIQTASVRSLTRRDALALAIATGASTLLAPVMAFADTQSDLDAAQKRYDEVQGQLKAIQDEYARLAGEQAQTLAHIEETQHQIDDTQKQIEEKEADLEKRKGRLGKRVTSAYKTGGTNALDILFASSSFEELVSNIYYLDKISESDSALIESVKQARQQLADQKSQLEESQAELKALNDQQTQQMQETQGKQVEAEELLGSLDSQVKSLVEQRDAELAAAAAAAASSRGVSRSGARAEVTGTGSQQAVLAACNSVGSPGQGLCAMWISQVMQAAGLGYPSGNANDMYAAWCYSSDRSELQPGMIVACSTHPHTSMGAIYGHIGFYVGNGTVMDNIGYIRSSSLDSWISYYGASVPVRWGWCSGIALA